MRISRSLSFMMVCVALSARAAAPVSADRELVKTLSGQLKEALTAALENSPEAAIVVCNERAPQIAAKLALENDVRIGRTALRVRNPGNAPAAWQREALEEFARRHAAGESLAMMESVSVVSDGDYIERRYLKAIGTEPLCVACHGASIAPSLQKAITEKYPQDAATGFDVGDLRGAAYVVRRERRR